MGDLVQISPLCSFANMFCSQMLAATAALRPETLVGAALSCYTWQSVKELLTVMAAMTAQVFPSILFTPFKYILTAKSLMK